MFNFSNLPEILQSPILDLSDVKSTLKLLQVNKALRLYHLTHGVSRKKVLTSCYAFQEWRDEDGHLLVKAPITESTFTNRQSLIYDPFHRCDYTRTGKRWTVDLKEERFLKLLLGFKATRGLLLTALKRYSREPDAAEFKRIEYVISRVKHTRSFRSHCWTYSVLASFQRFFETSVTTFWNPLVHLSDDLEPMDKVFLNNWIEKNLARCKRIAISSRNAWEFQKGLSTIRSSFVHDAFFTESIELGVKTGVLSANPEATMHFGPQFADEDDCDELVARLVNNPHLEEIGGDRAEIIWHKWRRAFSKAKDGYDRRFFKRKLVEDGRILVCMSEIEHGTKRIGLAMRYFKESLVRLPSSKVIRFSKL